MKTAWGLFKEFTVFIGMLLAIVLFTAGVESIFQAHYGWAGVFGFFAAGLYAFADDLSKTIDDENKPPDDTITIFKFGA